MRIYTYIHIIIIQDAPLTRFFGGGGRGCGGEAINDMQRVFRRNSSERIEDDERI